MKSIKQQYIDLKEGRMTQQNFMRNLRMTMPQYITNVTSFNDSVRILKNKGILTEADIKGKTIKTYKQNEDSSYSVEYEDGTKDTIYVSDSNWDIINNLEKSNLKEKNLDVDPAELAKGIAVEKEHTNDPVKAEEIALDHLAEDPQYYTKLDKIGLEEANYDIVDILLKYVKDPDDAAQYASMDPDTWPDWLTANMDRDPEYKKFHSGEPGLTGHMAKLAKDLANPFPQYKKLKANNVDLYPGNMGDEMSAPREGKLNEAKDEKGRWTNANGKSMYDQFKEIDNLNGQEVLIGIDYEIEKNHQLTKVEAAKIVIKNLKKNPIYYTSALMSGKEGYEPEYLGGKSANAEARQMQPVKDDNLVDKKMGMQPVKNIEKAKKDADAKKETNKIVKGVEELTFIAKTVRGVQKADPTGEKMKTIRESVDKALAKERLKEMIREEMKEIFDGRANMSYGMLGTKYDETGENK